jgi:predicted lipoprotein with Yx(FWY)xxD motif
MFFTDAHGATLYTFRNDETNKNNFTAADFSNNVNWPIYETDQIVVPSALDKTLFGTITVAGRKQLTYKGWPLYFFKDDAGLMGSTKGVSAGAPGRWPVAVKDIESPATKEIKLQTHASLGSIITDKDGRTLYYFVNDGPSQNNCPGGCALTWPVFNVENLNALQVGGGLSFTDFASITLANNGGKQITYKGRPLYYYAPMVGGVNTIEAAGAVGGDNYNSVGVWFVAKPDYSITLTTAQLVGKDGKNYTSAYAEGPGTTRYFTNANGVTLYTLSTDKQNKNTFTTPDFSNNVAWPIYETDKIVVPSSLDKTLFGVIDVFGKKQLTYKGWPLYFFGGDAGVMGSNKGVSQPAPGIWPVAVKDMPAAPPQ